MAVVFPKYAPKKGQPLDKDQINENFEVVVREVQGSLGEHNWESGAISSISSVDESAILRVHSIFQEVDHGFTTGATGPVASPTDSFKISTNREWVALKDDDATHNPMELTITTGNSLLWVIFSAQQEPVGAGNELPGCTYAIGVDGSIVHETLIGGIDRFNDKKGESIAMTNHPFSTDCLIPVSPGSHTITVYGRMVADQAFTAFDSTTVFYEVFNRQLTVIEMK